jgi:hypothetical protein
MSHDRTRRLLRERTGLALVIGAALCLALAGCASTPAASTSQPTAQLVQRLLELRLSRSPDVTAYRLFFAEGSTTPTSLAQAAAAEGSAKKPAIPQWDAPYVSSQTATASDVVVVWKASDAFPSHSAASVFTLTRRNGRWVITGARELAAGETVPPPLPAAK